MGSGQSSLPTDMVALFAFFGSTSTEYFSLVLATNSAARFLSPTASSEETRSSLPGPRISFKADASKASAAWISASAAAFGVSNPFCVVCGAAASFFVGDAPKGRPANTSRVETINGIFSDINDFDFIGFSRLNGFYRRRPPPLLPPPDPPPREPPPREPPMLEAPRL